MQQIVIEGFGGQGSETAGEIMVETLFRQGESVQGLPIYTPEQMGGNIIYVVRIDADGDRNVPYRDRDFLVLMHEGLATLQAFESLKPDGLILINTPRPPSDFDNRGRHVATVDGNRIARERSLVRANVSVVSTVMLGAFAKTTGLLHMETLREVMSAHVPRKLEENLAVMDSGYDDVTSQSVTV